MAFDPVTGFSGDEAAKQMQLLYVAYFDRPGDATGLSNNVGLFQDLQQNQGLTTGAALRQKASDFAGTQEAQNDFPFLASQGQQGTAENFVQNVFQSLFERQAEGDANDTSTGLGFWVDRVNQAVGGQDNLGQVILDIAAGAQNEDRDLLLNKVNAAQGYTDALPSPADYSEPEGRGALDQVTPAMTPQEAQQLGENAVGQGPGQGTTFTLTENADTVNGTGADDTINAPLVTSQGQQLNSFNGSDVIDGKGGTDTLFAAFPGQGAGFGETFIRSDVDNVENFELQNNFGPGLTFDWSLAEKSLGETHGLTSTTGPALYNNVPQAPSTIELRDLSAAASLTESINSGVLAGNDGTSVELTAQDVFPAAPSGPAGLPLTGAALTVAAEDDAKVRFTEVNATSNGTANNFGTFDLLSLDSAGDGTDEVLSVKGSGDFAVTAGDTVAADVLKAGSASGDIGLTFAPDTVQATSGKGDDTLTFLGDGGNTVATQQGEDKVAVTGDGDDEVSTGVGDDEVKMTGSGQHELTLGKGDDRAYVFAAGSKDTVKGEAGDDIAIFKGNLTASDNYQGGKGTDTVSVDAGFTSNRPGVETTEVLQLGTLGGAHAAAKYEVDRLVNTDIETVRVLATKGNIDAAGGAGGTVKIADMDDDTTVQIQGDASGDPSFDKAGDSAKDPEITQADDNGNTTIPGTIPGPGPETANKTNNIADDIGNVGSIKATVANPGGSDSLTFDLGRPEDSPVGGDLDELRIGTLTVPGVEAITLQSGGNQTSNSGPWPGGVGLANSFTGVALDSVTDLTIKGAKDLGLDSTSPVDTKGTLETVNAGNHSGRLFLNVKGDTDGTPDGGKDTSGVNLTAGKGADRLIGGPEGDTIRGGAGNDRLIGNDGADTLRGQDGNDTFRFNSSIDAQSGERIEGGDGNDIVDVDGPGGITVDFRQVQINGIESYNLGFTGGNADVTAQFRDTQLNSTATVFNIDDGAGFGAEVIKVSANENTTDLRNLSIDNDFTPSNDGDHVDIDGDSDATVIFGTSTVDVIDSGGSGGTPDEVTGGGGDDIFRFSEFDTVDSLKDFSPGDERLVLDDTAGMNSLGTGVAVADTMGGTMLFTAIDAGGMSGTTTGSTAGGMVTRAFTGSTATNPAALGAGVLSTGNTMVTTTVGTAGGVTNTAMATFGANGTLAPTRLFGDAGSSIMSALSAGTMGGTFSSALAALAPVMTATVTPGMGSFMVTLTGTPATFNLVAFAEASDVGPNSTTGLLAFQFSGSGLTNTMTTLPINTISIAEVGQDFSANDIFLA